MPLPETDVLGRDIRGMAATAERVILAVYGACGDCTQRQSGPLMIPRTKRDLVIVAWMSPDETVQSRARRYPLEFAMVADPDGAIAREQNAFWLPRLYSWTPGSESSSASNRDKPRNSGGKRNEPRD